MLRSPPSPLLSNLVAQALGLLALLLFATVALAASFPARTGHVVDQANVIPAETRTALEQKLSELEARTGVQLVVATVASLEELDIHSYAYELFRHWALGQRGRNNGVLILVAPHEKRVKIEVGDGLMGVLTDPLTRIVITNGMAPRFKAGDFGGGLTRGVDDLINALTATNSSDWQKRPALRLDVRDMHNPADWLKLIVPLIITVVVLYFRIKTMRMRWQSGGVRGPAEAARYYGSSRSWFGGRGYGGGGFGGGGGGTSSGGGASGRW